MSLDTLGLDTLAAGTLGWIRGNARFLDPFSAVDYQLPTTPRVKGIAQLALLRHYWARLRPCDEGLGEVTTLLRKMWAWPDLAREIASEPGSARQYGLMFGGLAPAGLPGGFHHGLLADLAASGYLSPPGKTPYARLEIRWLADKAGVRHSMDSYQELYASSDLARRVAPLPITDDGGCAVTHTIFYLSDFGFRDPGLMPGERERVLRLVGQLTEHYAEREEWDLAGKFILAQFCLGADPARTASGAAAIARLVQAQAPSGAIPGPSAARRAGASATEVEFFRKSYQATIVSALTAVIISSMPPGARAWASA